jgi:effector-binding domain-containing protein
MKALKIIGLVILALLAGYVIWAFTANKTVDVTRTIEINKDANTVYRVANDFHYYRKWSTWSLSDTAAKNEVTGTGREVGDVWSWDGEKVKQGSMTHIASVPGKSIENKVELHGGWDALIHENWTFEEKDGKTSVTWVEKSDDEIPLLLRPMMSVMMGSALDEGLKNLKNLIETMPALPEETPVAMTAPVAVEEMSDIFYIGIADSCEVSKIQENFTEDYGKLKSYMEKNKIESAGMPMGIFSFYDGKTTSFIAAFPVKGQVAGSGEIITGKIPAGKGLAITHLGSSEPAHMAISKYATDNNLKINTAIEIYENDPSTVKPEEIRTKVIYPIQG